MGGMIYLDSSATTPVLPEVWEAMRPFLTEVYGNPASAHQHGRKARKALEDAREKIAELLGAFPDEVVFTSGATEANNLALFGLAGDPPGRILASPVEHPCVVEPLRELEKRGFVVDWLTVDAEGHVPDVPLLAETRLVCVQRVNHETGAVQSVTRWTANAPLFHCDAAQAVGKMPVHFHELGVTTLSVS